MRAHADLDVAFVDTRAGQLGFSLSAAPRTPLAVADHRFGAVSLSIRLLGASHQVILTDGGHDLCETVACLPGTPSALPQSYQSRGYVFTSRIQTLDEDEIARVVDQVTAQVAAHTDAGLPALLGRFPGNPLAVTAVIADADADGVSWRTWHTYPQAGEVVLTSSHLDPEAPAVRR